MSDRADEYQQAELQKQVREAKEAWHRKQRRRWRYLASQIRKDPWATVQKLKAFGAGLGFIIRSLELMLIDLGNRGHLTPEGVDGALLLFGINPDDERIRVNEVAYMITLNNLGCLPDQPAPDLAKWLEPANRPFPLRNKPREELMGADGDACRAAIVKRVESELIPLRELQARVSAEIDEPALLEELHRASILSDEAARRVARCQAEVRATYHRAWRDLVKVLETGEEEWPSEPGDDDGNEANDQEKDQDKDKDGAADVTAEAVILDGPAPLFTGADPVPEPACCGSDESLPFQPEEIADPSAQLPEAVVVSIDPPVARVGGAKSAPCGSEGDTNAVETPRSGPGCHRAASAEQTRSVGPGSGASVCVRSSTFSVGARPSSTSTSERIIKPAMIHVHTAVPRPVIDKYP